MHLSTQLLLAPLGILLSALPPAYAQNCSIPPLSIPLRNTTFADGIAVNRGFQLLLGGGQQQQQLLGLRPSLIQNNTRVRNIRDCPSDPVGFSTCQGASGGVYSIGGPGGTFTAVSPDNWNVSHADPHPVDATIAFGYDVAQIPGTDSKRGAVVLPQLPIEVWSNANAPNKSELALGPSSSFLTKLVETALAPTRAFGLYFGSRSQDRGQDGSLTVGGVDAARFNASTLSEFPLSGYGAPIACPLQVMLTDVVLTSLDGKSSASLFRDPAARVPACVDTVQNAFTFTKAMWAEWVRLTQHVDSNATTGENFTAQTYPKDREALMGTLTITLANGYVSTIPHYELVSMERGTDAQGKYAVTNSSRVMAAVQTGEGDLGTDVPLLGGVFLSQNYLRVDYEAGKFWLAKAYTDKGIVPRVGSTCSSSASPGKASDGASSVGGGDGGGGGGGELGLKVGLPVAFVVVMTGVLIFWLFKLHWKMPLLASGQRRPSSSTTLDEKGVQRQRFLGVFSFGTPSRRATGTVRTASRSGEGMSPTRKRSELETTEKAVQLSAGDGLSDLEAGGGVSELQAGEGTTVAELPSPLSSPELRPQRRM